MQSNTSRATLSAQSSGTPSASTLSSSGKQQVVELSGYVIILVENVEGKIKLYGSPPDRDNLEVGDEILEVNGLTLDNISRTEVIRHIHDCIKSCTICLRVRKKNDSRLAWDIGNSVQDAFVIAVEEHARERLQRLAALNRVTPVDITQLSKKLQQAKGGAASTQKQDLSFLKEASPIYVTSFNSNHTACNSTTLTTASTSRTAGLISATTITPTAVAQTATNASSIKAQQPQQLQPTQPNSGTAVLTATSAGLTAVSKQPSANSATPVTTSIADRNANNNYAQVATPAANTTSVLTNHNSIFQATPLAKLPPGLQHKKLTIARSLQHLEVKEEDDDDDDLAALGANLCNINFINYKNKHAEIPTPTAATVVTTPFNTSTLTTTAGQSPPTGRRKSQTNAVSAGVDIHYSNTASTASSTTTSYHDHIPPPLQLPPPNKIYVDAQTLTSPRLIKDVTDETTVSTATATAAAAATAINKLPQQPIVQQPLLLNNNNNNNNNNLKPSQNSATSLATASSLAAAAATATALLHSNNNSAQKLPSTCSNLSNSIASNAQLTAATATATTSTPLATGITAAPGLGATSSSASSHTAGITPSNSQKISATNLISSNNCDLYLSTNNLQQQQQQQQQQPPRRELLTDDDEDEKDDDVLQLNANSLTNNLQQFNYSPNSSISKGGFELLLGDQTLRQDIRPRRRSGSSIVVLDSEDLKPCLPDVYNNLPHIRQTNEEDTQEIDQELYATMLKSINQDNGPHREMAVDCPDNFIARNKTPPRYPPPRPPQVTKSRQCIMKNSKSSPKAPKSSPFIKHTTTNTNTYTKKFSKFHNKTTPTTNTLKNPTSISATPALNLPTSNSNSTSKSAFTSNSSLNKLPLKHTHSNRNSPLALEISHLKITCNNTLPKCTAKYMQNNTKSIINYNSAYKTSSSPNQHQKQQHHNHKIEHLTTCIFTTCSLMELSHNLSDTNEQLQLQNNYNARQQLKLDQIENYENCLELERQTQKLNNVLPLKGKTSTVTNNPNGGGPVLASTGEDLDLMVDSLYRKDSSSHSSSFESEVLSKKSSESYDSISYRQLNNNNDNNHLNNKTSLNALNINSNNSSSSSSTSTSVNNHAKNNGHPAELLNGCNGGSGDSLPSITSSGSTPPPEYELKEFSNKNSILLPLIKHRELPVDVPDSFIEIVKTAPRYPPPPHLSSLYSQLSSCSSASTANTTLTRINSCNNSNTESHNMSFSPQSLKNQGMQMQETSLISTMSLNGSYEDFQQQQQLQPQQQGFHQLGTQKPQPQVAGKRLEELNGQIKPVPPPRDTVRIERTPQPPQLPDRRGMPTINNVAMAPQQIAQIVEPTLEQLDSIKKYQNKSL